MSSGQGNNRKIEIYRYDPTKGGDGHFDTFDLQIEDESNTTILDVLIRIQMEQDATLAFRYACRVNMCGSCGMVINGREGLACKTNVSDFARNERITIRPFNHFPVVKDLVVDMDPFFKNYEKCLPFFEPKKVLEEPEIIRPDSQERQAIGLATECIACGCCVSSCTMVNYHEGYAGPAPLNRAFTLLMDSRDALFTQRMDKVLQSCYNCRTEFNCTEVCPKEISSTRAIKFIQRLAMKEPFRKIDQENPEVESCNNGCNCSHQKTDEGRREFLTKMTLGIGAASVLVIGGVLATTFVGPSMRKKKTVWVPAGKVDDLPIGEVTTLNLRYKEKVGIYEKENVTPVMVWCQSSDKNLVVYNSRCTHLGCTVRWDNRQNSFLCACHGGKFALDGSVTAGPPPRPLDHLDYKIENGNLLLAMVS